MSLDVYLEGPPQTVECRCSTCWHKHEREECEELYSRNITHNLNTMADNAGIYQALWRPEELSITRAKQLIARLEVGLAKLEADPEHFKQWDAENGWGLYKHLVSFVRGYLEACREYPDAHVRVSR